MLKPLLLAVLVFIPFTAQAGNGVLATLRATSGSLAPEYAWSVTVSIGTDKLVTVTRCKGYDTEGPACTPGTAVTTDEALEAIRLAAKSSGLATRPARPLDPPMVGGGLISGTVLFDGQMIDLIAQPAPEDEERVRTVIDIIGAAIPRKLDPILSGD